MFEILAKKALYFHALFAFMIYLFGSFFTIVLLEYKLKNVNLKHTLAGFVSVLFSGLIAYFIPVFLLTTRSLTILRFAGIISALVIQGLFWMLWFKDEFKKYLPALIVAFVLTIAFALFVHYSFVSYVNMMIGGAVKGAATKAVTGILSDFM
ncbi:hypothetical protein KAH94_04285 [bacterium]|nr:hypothetical protein [bacterium]